MVLDWPEKITWDFLLQKEITKIILYSDAMDGPVKITGNFGRQNKSGQKFPVIFTHPPIAAEYNIIFVAFLLAAQNCML
jgi:hypothetical protein